MIILGHWDVMSSRIILLLGLVRTLGADPHQTPLETMADVTNDFGICVLQMIATDEDNTVFSPYGLMSMALLVYEGATGQTAAQLYGSLHLPWHRDIVRVGFRDLHRYLRSYFSSEGFLKGLVLSKANVSLKPSYVQVLKFYGFQTETSTAPPVLTTVGPEGEKDNNEQRTTSIPETTTFHRVPTTFTTPRLPTTRKATTLKPSGRPTMKPVVTTTTRKPPQGSITTTTRKPPQGSITTTTRKPPQGSITTTTRKPPQGSITTTTRKPPQGSITTTTRKPPQGSITTTTRKPPQGFTTTRRPPQGVTTTRKPPQGSLTTTRQPNQGLTTTTRKPIQGAVTTTRKPSQEITTTSRVPASTSVNTVTIFTQTTEGATKQTETTLANTGGTTKREESATEFTDPLITEEIGSDASKTTREPNTLVTEEVKPTEEISTLENEQSNTQVGQTSTEMNVVPDSNQELQELESMNMVLLQPHQSYEISTDFPHTTFLSNTDVELDFNEIELSTHETDITYPESNSDSEIEMKEVFTDTEQTDTMAFSTMFADTTVPVEEVVILTTPPNDNMISSPGMSMLEAIILMENTAEQEETQEKDTSMNPVSKRSTIPSEVIPAAQNSTEVSNLFSILSGNKSEYEALLLSSSTIQFEGVSTTNYQHEALVNGYSMEDSNGISYETTNQTINELNFTYQYPEDQTEDTTETITGLPTLEPDIIIFPTLRLPRAAVREGENEKKRAPLGNWVGAASGWHPNPSSQWFWTASGENLVPVLAYTAYLPFVDLPNLSATAVQLPLDDSRYSLMVLLPKNVRGLQQMLRSLQWSPLRNILNSFKPTPVYAVVPTFTIVKHINLTPALHKLGVRNIFDAYLANLCEMSSEPNLYVRSVEQVITISVQKYFTFHKWFEATESQVEQHFLATHPFAYFVVDLETKVALISGTIVDPQVHNT